MGPTSHAFREGCEHVGARRFQLEMVMRARPRVRGGTDHTSIFLPIGDSIGSHGSKLNSVEATTFTEFLLRTAVLLLNARLKLGS